MKTLDSITYYACRILPVVVVILAVASCLNGCAAPSGTKTHTAVSGSTTQKDGTSYSGKAVVDVTQP